MPVSGVLSVVPSQNQAEDFQNLFLFWSRTTFVLIMTKKLKYFFCSGLNIKTASIYRGLVVVEFSFLCLFSKEIILIVIVRLNLIKWRISSSVFGRLKTKRRKTIAQQQRSRPFCLVLSLEGELLNDHVVNGVIEFKVSTAAAALAYSESTRIKISSEFECNLNEISSFRKQKVSFDLALKLCNKDL